MNRRDIPNLITSLRMILVLPLAWSLWTGHYAWAFALFCAGGISDGIDGFLARRFGWQTELGALLDPVADKFFLVSVYLVLGLKGLIPVTLVAAVLGRDAVIIGGAAAYRFRFRRLDMAPSLPSKLNTALQILLVAVVMMSTGLGWLPVWSSNLLIDAVFASTVLSGIHYVAVWSRRAHREARRRDNEPG